ncbi:MAG: redoxin domain-containing protein [Rhodanobacteraceae bacterium]|nr:redoxin domain-containing protein [Rhodanobacteraceae bacterium]MBK7042787.1 redoxin domain-containing protein [Rhodanobacteraceae bacterium]MBP9155890.1 redoxin domain-containing protein [Xanthomonadales bacterium]HQW81829.1 redoxin domain-containing protein [Pseudomonadota bacterium]
MNQEFPLARPLHTSQWFNSPPLQLADLRGRVVVLEVFQMLCPGCVSHALPQALEIAQTFARDDVAVIGLHSVFEHHAAMTPVGLEAFLHEYRIGFPVGVDAVLPGSPTPATMQAYAMQGTPTTILIDRAGRLRLQHFGRLRDLAIGAQIAALVGESAAIATAAATASAAAGCDDNGCPLPG